MDKPVNERGQAASGGNALDLIHAGMMVVDRDGQQVGSVDAVFHGRPEDQAAAVSGAGTPANPGGATRTEKSPTSTVADSSVTRGGRSEGQATAGRGETLQDHPAPPGTPPPVETSDVTLQAALGAPHLRRGYIRLGDTDLPERARFVAVEQIERSDDWRVFLKLTLAELEAGETDPPD